jgi:hypothetical protein
MTEQEELPNLITSDQNLPSRKVYFALITYRGLTFEKIYT